MNSYSKEKMDRKFFNKKNINNLKVNINIIEKNYLKYYEKEPCPCPYKSNYKLNFSNK